MYRYNLHTTDSNTQTTLSTNSFMVSGHIKK